MDPTIRTWPSPAVCGHRLAHWSGWCSWGSLSRHSLLSHAPRSESSPVLSTAGPQVIQMMIDEAIKQRFRRYHAS